MKWKALLSAFLALIVFLSGVPLVPGTDSSGGKAHASMNLRIVPSEISTDRGETADIIFSFNASEFGEDEREIVISLCTAPAGGGVPELGDVIKTGVYKTKENGVYIEHTERWDGKINGVPLPEGRYTICVSPAEYDGTGVYYGQMASFEIVGSRQPKAPGALTIEPAASGMVKVSGSAEPNTTVRLEVREGTEGKLTDYPDIPVGANGAWSKTIAVPAGQIAQISAKAAGDGRESSYSEQVSFIRVVVPAYPISWGALAAYYYRSDSVADMASKAQELARINGVDGDVCTADGDCSTPVSGLTSVLVPNPQTAGTPEQADLAQFTREAIEKRLRIVNPTGSGPVDPARGDFTYSTDSLVLQALMPISYRLTYLSREPLEGAAGLGWRHSYEWRLVPAEDGKVELIEPTGARYEYVPLSGGRYLTPRGTDWTLAKDGSGHLLSTPQGTAYRFNGQGLLQSITDPNGNAVQLAYNGEQLVSVSTNGASLSFTYGANGRLAGVQDHSGRSISYTYDVAGNLVAITDTDSSTTKLTYDDKHRVISVTDPKQTAAMTVSYDEHGRVTGWTDFYGEGSQMDYAGKVAPVVRGEEDVEEPDPGTGGPVRIDPENGRDIPESDKVLLSGTMHNLAHAPAYLKVEGMQPVIGNYLDKLIDRMESEIAGYKASAISCSSCDVAGIQNAIAGSQADPVVIQAGHLNLDGDATFGSPTKPVILLVQGMNTNQANAVTIYGTLIVENALNANQGTKLTAVSVGGKYGSVRVGGPVHLNNDSSVTVSDTLYAGNLTYNNGTLQVNARRVVVEGQMHINTNVEMNISGEMVVGAIVSNNQVGNLNITGGDLYVRDTVHVNNNLNVTTGGVWAIGGDMTPNKTPLVRSGVGSGKSTLFYPNLADGRVMVLSASAADNGDAGYTVSSTLAAVSETTQTDALGNATTYVWSDRFLLLERREADGTVVQFGYDDASRRTSVKDGNGNVNRAVFDERGNMTQFIEGSGESTVIRYNASNDPVERVDALGRTTSYAYDAKGNLTQVTDGLGNTTRLEWDARGVLTSHTDANGETTRYVNDAHGFVQAIEDPAGYTVEFERDALHRITRVKDGKGTLERIVYDAKDRVVEREDALGQKSFAAYDENGNLIETIDEAGNKTVYTYDVYRLTAVEDALNHISRTEYDAAGNVTREIDANGGVTEYAYDALGRVVKVTDPDGHVSRYTYDDAGNVLTFTDGTGSVTRYTYDKNNQLLTVTDATGAVTQYSYDASGRKIKETNPLGNSTWYDYDEAGRLIAVTNALGGVTRYAYDANGRLIEQTLPDGSVWKTKYDSRGLEAGTIDSLGRETFVTRDDRGRVTAFKDAAGAVTRYEYDELDRNTKIVNALGHETIYEYDPLGNVAKIIDANQGETAFQYDALGRLTGVTDALGGVTSYSYDAAGNLVEKKDALGRATTYRYNKRNLVVESVNPLGEKTVTAYDAAGNVTTVTAPDLTTTTYSYDPAHRLKQIEYGDGQKVSFTYDLAGRRIEMVDSSGLTRYTYDALDRLTEVIDPRTQNTRYEWTPVGQRSRIVYPDNSSVYYEYDAAGQLVKVMDESGTTHYEYDANGRVVKRTLPNGGVSTYTYDALGQVTEIRHAGPGGELLEQLKYVYDPVGNLTRRERTMAGIDEDNPAGTTRVDAADYVYDALNQLTTVQRLNGKRTAYTYDAVGNRLSKTVTDGGITTVEQYVYDAANKLLHWTNGVDTKDYEYDLRGNLVKVTGTDSSALRIALEGLPEQAPTVGDVTYGLPGTEDPIYTDDGDGAQGVPEGSGEEEEWLLPDAFEASLNALAIGTYQWNAADRLVRYTDASGNAMTYRYNGDGHRIYMGISIADGSVQDGYMPSHPAGVRDGWEPQYKKRQMDIYFVNDITQAIPLPLTATDATGTAWKQNYVYGALGERISMSYLPSADSDNGWEPQPGSSGAAPNTPAKTLYYLSDALGSALALQASDGRISARYQYDEFGIPEQPEKFDPNWPGPDNLFGYTGLGYDYYSGLTFANARYFDPTIGRFISEDTYEGELNRPLSQNLYTYVYNNPLTWTDPTGHMAWHQIDDLGLGVYDALKSTVKELLSWDTYVGIYEFGKALVKGEITFADLLKALGNTAKAKIDYFAKNTKHVFAGKPTSKEVRRYGYEVGEILTMIGGSTAAVKLVTKVAPKLARLLNSGKLSKKSACNCFTAGTKVLTDEGEKPIEEIRVGDKVLAKDDETGEMAYKEVEWLFQRDVEETYNITVGDEVITTTDEHPFWIVGKGWVEAQHLAVGDVLTTSDGKELAIENIEVKKEHKTVYNFMVKDFHTYFVTNLGIWTHNACSTPNTTTKWDIKSNAKAELTYNFHGQKVKAYQDSNGYWWAKDTTGHGGSAYKVFEKKGKELHWVADADEYGNWITDKHKSQTGMVIKLN